MNTRLEEERKTIKKERLYVDRKPYSHNIISITLQIIAKEFGKEEAKKAVRDFKLETLGWRQEK
jgi:hypothetical protein